MPISRPNSTVISTSAHAAMSPQDWIQSKRVTRPAAISATSHNSNNKAASPGRFHLLKEQVLAIDKNAVIFNPAWMKEILAHSLAARRFTMTLLTGIRFHRAYSFRRRHLWRHVLYGRAAYR